MTQQMHDALYNKTIKDVTKEDLELYTNLINLNAYKKTAIWAGALALPIVVPMGIMVLPSMPLVTIALTGFVELALVPLSHLAININANDSISKLGLSKKEFKAFKKSGGLKRIRKILKEYKKNPYKANKIYPLPNGLTVEDLEKNEPKNTSTKKEIKQQKLIEQQKLEERKNADKVLGRNFEELEK